MSEQTKTLEEWYMGYTSSEEPKISYPSTADLSQTISGTAQDEIQKEMKAALEQDKKIDVNDAVVLKDKQNIIKALRNIRALENILILLDDLTNPYEDAPLQRQNLIDKAKKITDNIVEIVSSL